MATVTIRGATSAASSVNTTSQAITLPTCTAGDLLYLFVVVDQTSSTPTTPTGWTLVESGSARSNNYGFLYSKTADGSESGATLTLTLGAGSPIAVGAIALLATQDVALSGFTAKNTDGTSLTLPAITPTAADCLRIGFVSSESRPGTDTPGMTAPAGWTEQVDAWSTLTSIGNEEVGIYTIQLSGQAGTAQATAAVAVPGNAHSGLTYCVTVAPAAEPAPTSTTFIRVAGEWVAAERLVLVDGEWV